MILCQISRIRQYLLPVWLITDLSALIIVFPPLIFERDRAAVVHHHHHTEPVTVNVIGRSFVCGVAPLVESPGFEAPGYGVFWRDCSPDKRVLAS